MPRVLSTPLAQRDLAEIALYLAQKSQSAAISLQFLDAVGSRCDLYARQPQIGERCPDLGETVRRFTVGSHVVFYQPLPDGIELLRVLHGSRDVPTAWRERFR